MAEYLSQKPSIGLGSKAHQLKVHTTFDQAEEQNIAQNLEAEDTSLDLRDTADVRLPSSDISQKLNALNIYNGVAIANQAFKEIVDIRERQLALAKTAKDSPEDTGSSHRDNLNTELSQLQTEIDRIYSSATFNDQNMIQGGFQGLITIDSLDIKNKVIGYGDFSSSLGSLGASLTTVSNATSAYNSLDQNLTSLRTAQTDIETALDEASSVLNLMTSASVKKELSDQNKIIRANDADILAQKIDNNIQDLILRDAENTNTKRVIEFASIRLESDRVIKLTEDN